MTSIDALLNHESASAHQEPQSHPPNPPREPYSATTTTFEAADALTALATMGNGQQYALSSRENRELPSPTNFSHAPRRSSSFGSHAAPVEPSPPIELPHAHSPTSTLDQYHHGSRSPEEQRRQSLLQRNSSPAPPLAPIQNLSAALNHKINGEEPQSAMPDDEINHRESAPASHGQDISQIVPPPSQPGDEGESVRDETQNREPAFVRAEPTTAQIREPESMNSTPHLISTQLPPLPDSETQLPSPLPAIKNEPAGTPRENTPSATIVPSSERHPSVTAENVDAETRRAIEAVKQNDLGLRAKRPASVADSVTSPSAPTDPKPVPLPAPSKKRPAPSSAIKKKGTAATKKPAPKRRKIDPEVDSVRSTTPTATTTAPARSRPRGKKGSQAGTPAAESSPAPDNSPRPHASDDDGDSSDDTTLYCICRKPDNHRWMIGCDGGCDDWFHGSCVNMVHSDEDLVDKFICPNCEEIGRGQTSWKPMCRRDGCRKPARLVGRESKYCSDECGVLFMQDQLQRTAGAKKSSSALSKKSKKKGTKDSEDPGNATDEDEEPTPLGGVLRSKDLKALVVASSNIEDFKRLGSGVLSPPQTASPSQPTFDAPNSSTPDLPFTSSELARLQALQIEKLDLKTKLEALKDREKFVSLVREQASRLAERDKIKPKEFCGYDPRLAWSDAEFLAWRHGKLGCAAFTFATLDPTPEQLASLDIGTDADGDGDVRMNGTAVNGIDAVCTKKRCPKHPQWQKLNLQDARFEEVEAVEAIKECEKEERQVRERARRRGRKDLMEAEFVGVGERKGRNREGWVERVGG